MKDAMADTYYFYQQLKEIMVKTINLRLPEDKEI